MPTVSNTAEGGTDGVVVTTGNSGGGSGDAFDSMTGNANAKYSNAHPSTGSMGIDLFGALGQTNGVTWTRSFGSTVYARIYCYWDNVSLEFYDDVFAVYTSGMAVRNARGIVFGGGSPTLHLQNAAGADAASSSMSFAVNTLYRVEFKFVSHASAGTVEARIYAGHDTSPLESPGASSVNTNGGSIEVVQTSFGNAGSAAHRWIDDFTANDTGWPGPAVVAEAPSLYSVTSPQRW